MKVLITIITSLIITVSHGQYSACSQFGGDYNQIKSEMIKRAKAKNMLSDGKTDTKEAISKWDEYTIGLMAERWVKVCKCEQGVTESEWQSWQKHNELNRMSFQGDDYNWHGQFYKKDISVFGDLTPPNRQFISSDCIKGQTNDAEITYTDCWDHPDYVGYDPKKDPKQYIKSYIIADCMCSRGVKTDQEAEHLYTQMLLAYNDVKTYYPNNTYTLEKPIGPEQCSRITTNKDGDIQIESGSKFLNIPRKANNFKEIYSDDLIGSGAQNLIHDLAANSNNPYLQKLSSDFHEISNFQSEVHSQLVQYGFTMSEADQQFMQLTSNVRQVIAVGKFVVDLIRQKPELPPEVKQANAFIANVNSNIKLIYNETRLLPMFESYDEKTLNQIEQLQTQFLSYDLATAVERYLIIQYNTSKNWFTIDEITDLFKEIETMDPIDIILKIDEWQKNNQITGNNFLANSDVCFNNANTILETKKVKCYRNMGKDDKADETLEKLHPNINNDVAINAMSSAFKDGNFELANFYYPLVKEIFISESKPQEAYLFLNGTSLKALLEKTSTNNLSVKESKEGNSYYNRTEVVQMLAIGAYTAIKNKNYSEAKNELEFLKKYVSNQPIDYDAKKNVIENAIVLGLEASNLNMQGDKIKALNTIDLALKTYDENDINFTGGKIWLQQIKFELLADNGEFEKAHSLYVEINTFAGIHTDNDLFFNAYDIKFKKCEMLFMEKQYDRVLHGLSILETLHPLAKYHLLRSKVYLAQGKEDLALKELELFQTFNQ